MVDPKPQSSKEAYLTDERKSRLLTAAHAAWPHKSTDEIFWGALADTIARRARTPGDSCYGSEAGLAMQDMAVHVGDLLTGQVCQSSLIAVEKLPTINEPE